MPTKTSYCPPYSGYGTKVYEFGKLERTGRDGLTEKNKATAKVLDEIREDEDYCNVAAAIQVVKKRFNKLSDAQARELVAALGLWLGEND